MTGRVGLISQNSEIWVRCPYCGDSQNDPTKAHMTINPAKALYHCRRCNAGGRLSYSQILKIMYDQGISLDEFQILDPNLEEAPERIEPDDLPELQDGPGSSRASVLSRYHLDHGLDTWDAFKIRDGDLETVGILLRRPGKSVILGSGSGLMWYGDWSLNSLPTDPLYIVEGPYDALRTRDVCVGGMISHETMKRLKGHSLVLTPDGDVWTDPLLFLRIANSIERILRNGEVYLVGLEVVPSGKDPDEVPPNQRMLVRRSQIMKFLREVRRIHGIDDSRRTSWKRKVISLPKAHSEVW